MNKSLVMVCLRCLERYREGYATRRDVQADTSWNRYLPGAFNGARQVCRECLAYAAECFKSVTKWTKRLTDWELNSYWTQKALRETCSYPPGPVCLEFR